MFKRLMEDLGYILGVLIVASLCVGTVALIVKLIQVIVFAIVAVAVLIM